MVQLSRLVDLCNEAEDALVAQEGEPNGLRRDQFLIAASKSACCLLREVADDPDFLDSYDGAVRAAASAARHTATGKNTGWAVVTRSPRYFEDFLRVEEALLVRSGMRRAAVSMLISNVRGRLSGDESPPSLNMLEAAINRLRDATCSLSRQLEADRAARRIRLGAGGVCIIAANVAAEVGGLSTIGVGASCAMGALLTDWSMSP